jgi:hypothetical protein
MIVNNFAKFGILWLLCHLLLWAMLKIVMQFLSYWLIRDYQLLILILQRLIAVIRRFGQTYSICS